MDLSDASFWELAGYAALLILSGTVAGFLAGLFGIGGGAVIVPVLYEVFSAIGIDEAVRMHLAVGTSIAIIVPTSIRSFAAHHRRGAADTALLRSWLIAVPAGVVIACVAAIFISGAGLRGIFAVLSLIFGLRFMLAARLRPIAPNLPRQPVLSLVGAGIGFLSTLMGIGGGVINNTFMTLFGRPMLQAVATSAGVGLLISVPGLVGYMAAGWGNPDLPVASLGYVNFIAAAILIPATTLAAPFGVRMAHAVDRRFLEIGFGAFLVIVAVRFAFSLG